VVNRATSGDYDVGGMGTREWVQGTFNDHIHGMVTEEKKCSRRWRTTTTINGDEKCSRSQQHPAGVITIEIYWSERAATTWDANVKTGAQPPMGMINVEVNNA
jgi:hypothetical protein